MLFIYRLIHLFLLFSLIISILGVISCRFLMEKIFSLIAVFVILSFLLIIYGFEFLPLVILLLYVGAISVLFLFVVIIVNPDYNDILEEEKILYNLWVKKNETINLEVEDSTIIVPKFKSDISNKGKSFFDRLLSYKAIIYFYFGNIFLIFNSVYFNFYTLIVPMNQKYDLFIIPINSNKKIIDIYYIAQIIYSQYSICLIIIGIILLVAIIGTIILTIRKSSGVKKQNISNQCYRYR